MAGRTGTRRLRVALFLAVGLAATGIGLVAYGTNVFETSICARWTSASRSGPGRTGPKRRRTSSSSRSTTRRSTISRNAGKTSVRSTPKLIRQLKADGAKVIVYDVQFTEPSRPGHEEDDNKLIEAVGDAGNVVLATTRTRPSSATTSSCASTTDGSAMPNFPHGSGRLHPPDAVPDRDAEDARGRRGGARAGRTVKPFGTTWIDFRGPAETFKTISFSDALAREGPARLLPGQDRRRRPVGVDVPGPASRVRSETTPCRAPRSRRTRSRPCSGATR